MTPNASDAGLDIPDFLGISAEERKRAWAEYDARKAAAAPTNGGRVISETEKLYRESIERDRAIAQYHRDRARFAFFERKAAEQAEIEVVKEAARKAHRARRHPRNRGANVRELPHRSELAHTSGAGHRQEQAAASAPARACARANAVG